MSRTDNHVPARLWSHYGLRFDHSLRVWKSHQHQSLSKEIARRFNRQDRHIARAALRRGLEPEPRQTRHRAHFEAF